MIKKYLSLFIVILLVASPAMAATSNDMTDPLTYLLKLLGQGKGGAQGPQGEPGITTVIYNNTNITGPAGPQGPQGIQGIPGTNGINGTSPSVMVNYTFTGDPGTNAGVTNIGSIWDVRLDFLIPSGAQGPQGIQGLTGAQGPAGSQGPAGINGTDGATGATGATGPQGIQGLPGNDGATGPQGIPGINGTDGAVGPQGDQGIQGIQGIQGPQGIPGINGTNGTNGEDGQDGEKGETGAQGIQGIQGATGATGAQGPAGPMDVNVAFINGTRAFTANLSMGSNYINNLITGGLGSDAVNRSFVTGQGYITSTFNSTYDATSTKVTSNLNAWNSTYNSTYDAKPSSIPDQTQFLFLNGTRSMTGGLNLTTNPLLYADYISLSGAYPLVKGTTDSLSTSLYGGTTGAGKSAIVQAYGADHATLGGRILFYVTNTGKNGHALAMQIVSGDAPYLYMQSNRIASVGAPTTNGDALIYDDWTAWTPTLAWGTGTPASVTTNARWQQTGKTVYFSFSTSSADSNGASSLSFTLPKNMANMNSPVMSGWEYNGGASPLSFNPIPYINSGTPGSIQFWAFRTGTDGQWIEISVTGFYEVA